MPAIDLDESLRTAIARQLRVSVEDLTVDRTLDDLGLDNLDTAVGVLEAVEDLLEVRFPDDFFDGVATFGQLTSVVRLAVGI